MPTQALSRISGPRGATSGAYCLPTSLDFLFFQATCIGYVHSSSSYSFNPKMVIFTSAESMPWRVDCGTFPLKEKNRAIQRGTSPHYWASEKLFLFVFNESKSMSRVVDKSEELNKRSLLPYRIQFHASLLNGVALFFLQMKNLLKEAKNRIL